MKSLRALSSSLTTRSAHDQAADFGIRMKVRACMNKIKSIASKNETDILNGLAHRSKFLRKFLGLNKYNKKICDKLIKLTRDKERMAMFC